MRKKTALVVIGLVGLFVGVALVAAWLTDVITEDHEVVMEDPGPGFPVSDRLAGADDGSTDVGSHAVLVPATVALPPPLLPGEPAWMATGSAGGPPAPTPTIADQPTSGGPGATPTTAPTTTADATTSTATTTPSTAGPAVADASPAIGTLWRFLDLCADQPVPQCPAGIGATVLFGGGSAPPPPLAFDIFPDPPQAIRDQVRCDLAWPSGTVLPVLLTSNQPLDVADARLRIRNGAAIDSVLDQRTMPTEVGWYEQRVLAGALVGTSVGDGVHTCLAFRLDGPAAPTGIDRNGYFEVEVTAYVGSRSHTVTRRFDGHYLAGKPSVRVIPVDGYRATVIVPQRQNDNVTVTLFTTSQDHGSPGRGACPTNSQQKLIGFLTPRNPGVGPPAYPPAQLADPGYPFDRDYTHYRVWDLYLKSGQDYVLCISWELDGVREHWVMQTPASYRVYVGGTTLGYNRTVAEGSLLLRIPGIEDCWVANPGQFSADGRDPFPEILLQHHSGWETWRLPDPTLCNSNGWRLPETIEIEARLTAPGDTTLYGITRIPLHELLAKLNELGGKHGIGRLDLVENRYVGMKSRGCYETPGGTILLKAHRAIESITLDREVAHLKDDLMPRYASMIYNGYWWAPERVSLQALIDQTQLTVNGWVRLKLYKGNVIVVGRDSKTDSLFDPTIATFEDDAGAYDQKDAHGFIRLNALRMRIAANARLKRG